MWSNDCGGDSINYVLSVDAHVETDHYNSQGELIGLSEQPYGFPCFQVRNVYGTQCARTGNYREVDCTFDSDAGR